ncbi:TatD family hydrolase [Methylomonas koyamae]|uniref:TatD family hydrolase n=1 Tax=Methylomonas koyamae TaxID=702114 RepID=UPI001129EA5C|nr:TatD family hydrolase [Methylomonas koyamae]TPQ26416.1 deoxyribonuclease [Methylomonas koyamae]
MLMPHPLIDIHCHADRPATGCRISSLDISTVVDGLYLQSETAEPNRYVSIGIHPWFIARQPLEQSWQKLQALCIDPQVIAIGECGLDRCTDAPLTTQSKIFSWQIELSERLGKPLIVHCVRAFAELLGLRKAFKPAQPWIIHGFSGKPALAQQLIKPGCYLSFGKALLKPDSRASQTLPTIPLDRLFLETDAADDISIAQIYAAAAKILGLDVGALSAELHRNFTRVFLHD